MQLKEYTNNKGQKRYELRAYIGRRNGKQVEIHRRNLKTKSEAKAIYKNAIYEFKENKKTYKTKFTYGKLYNIWIELYRKKVKESTLQKTTKTFQNHILPVFKDTVITEISPLDCQKFINSLENMTSGRVIYNYAKTCMNYAYTIDLIPSNPFDKVIYPKFKETKVHTDFLEKDQVKQLLDVIDDLQWLIMFRLLIYLGLRKGELLALHWNNIDFYNKTVSIEHTLSYGELYRLIRTPAKNKSSIASLSLDTESLRLLRQYKKTSTSIIVFPNKKGGYITPARVGEHLDKYLNKAGLPHIRVHDLRHTTASLLFESGASMKEVQGILRHGDIKTTMNIYSHVTKDSKEKTINNFAQYLES